MKKYKTQMICFILAIIHMCVTFVTDSHIFEFPNNDAGNFMTARVDYIICKAIALGILYLFYYGLYLAIMDKSDKHNKIVAIVKTALPYLVVVVGVLLIKLPGGYITNDENSIYSNAVTLTHDTWFYYLTTYYYIVSLMLVPFKYGPIIIKAIIQLLTVGYVVYRIKHYFGNKVGMFGYVLFLLYPVIAYTSSAHRLPVYFLVYLMIFTKLLFDGLEKKKASVADLTCIIIAGAMLTQWRTEGIYMAVFIPIVCFLTYANIRNKRGVIYFIIAFVAVQYIVSIPQNGFTAKNLDDAANDRMKPFYAYTITNMYRNGLNLEKNAEDLAIVDKYISLDVIKAINEHYVDINYEDVLILYQEGFVGVREDASVEDFINYSDAVKRIFINNPDVFIRTRWGAFCYAALPYHINYTGMGVKSLVQLGISVVKTVMYNLFIPSIICVCLCVASLIRRKWYSFFVLSGLLAHWFIVFILAPASYFKYYFPVYIMGYFYLMILAIFLYCKKIKGADVISPLR